MSISNYTELQAAVSNWLNRSSNTKITNRVPEFIDMGESMINRNPRGQMIMQTAVSDLTYAATDTDRTISLPTGFLKLVNLSLKPAVSSDQSFFEPRLMTIKELESGIQGSGRPVGYTIQGNEIQFSATVRANWTVRVTYIKMWDIATDTTNWLLTNAPDIYVAASMAAACPFIRKFSDVSGWKAQMEQGLEALSLQAHKTNELAEAGFDRFPGKASVHGDITRLS